MEVDRIIKDMEACIAGECHGCSRCRSDGNDCMELLMKEGVNAIKEAQSIMRDTLTILNKHEYIDGEEDWEE